MAKKSQGSDKITPTVKRNKGVQEITPGGDFGAREMWNEATNPTSVKKMVGSDKEFSPYKHDEM